MNDFGKAISMSKRFFNLNKIVLRTILRITNSFNLFFGQTTLAIRPLNVYDIEGLAKVDVIVLNLLINRFYMYLSMN